MFFEDPVFWMRTFVWNISEQKVSKNTVRRSMRKTLKNDPKNQSKTHQKTSKNAPKKHTKKKTPKPNQKWAKVWPKHDRQGREREGSRMESSFKKKECCETKPTAGKGACWKETRRLWPNPNTPLRRASTRPGGEFRLPKAIVPPPGRGKIICMRKFARNLMPGSMQEVFLQISALKDEFRPKRDETKPRGCEITKIWP